MKTISIILTTYNSGKTIQRAIDSVNRQEGLNKLFEIELIVVDDCSADDTREILSKNNIDFISTKKNSGGPNIGRNIGLEKATGDYICLMDHDDDWLPDKLKSQLALVKIADIISSGYIEIDDRKGQSREYVNHSIKSSGYNYYDKNVTFLNHLMRSKHGQKAYIGGLMYHKSLRDIKFEEKYGMVDFDWFLRLFHGRDSVEVCKPLFVRHMIGANLSLSENYRINDYKYSLETLNSYKDLYPKEVSRSAKRINGTMARYYYSSEKMKLARRYFLKSGPGLKNLGYLLSSFYGYRFVNRKFKVF